jgi:hypothetical protein
VIGEIVVQAAGGVQAQGIHIPGPGGLGNETPGNETPPAAPAAVWGRGGNNGDGVLGNSIDHGGVVGDSVSGDGVVGISHSPSRGGDCPQYHGRISGLV